MNKQFKKDIRNHFLKMVLGVAIIIPLWTESSWLRFFALAGAYLVVINFLWFVRNSEIILFKLFPTQQFREHKPRFVDVVWSYFAMGILFVGLISIVWQMRSLENIIEETEIWQKFGLVGIVVGIMFLLILRFVNPAIYYESGRRYGVIFGMLLGLPLISISAATFTNIEYAYEPDESIEVFVDSKGSSSSRSRSYYLFLEIEGSIKRFEVSHKVWEKILEQSFITVETRKGYLGYTMVTRFE